MIKKRKKILFIFIVIVIAVLLFSVIGVITVYLAGPQQPTYIDTQVDAIPGGTVTITTGSGDTLTGTLSGAN